MVRDKNEMSPDLKLDPSLGPTWASTMREEYLHPKSYAPARQDLAKRRALFYSKTVAEVTEQILLENQEKDKTVEYCTTYDDMYRIPGFKVNDELPDNTELYLKYPLYNAVPITYYSQIVKSQPKDVAASLPGMTKITDPLSPFKKNGQFTKPLDEQYCEDEIS